MDLGPFYTGQVPREPLTIIVRDAFTDRAVDLTGYDEAALVLVDPNDVLVMNGAESEWPGSIANPSGGEVQVQFDTSPFEEVGDYELQLVLRGGTAEDITSTTTFEVYERLGA